MTGDDAVGRPPPPKAPPSSQELTPADIAGITTTTASTSPSPATSVPSRPTDDERASQGAASPLAGLDIPEEYSGVALPAETAAETEAVLEAIAADEGGRVDQSDSDNDAEEILEESPDKRWSKRREKVKQRDVPGIDVSYLAMDNETGNEVVWNEVQFSERKNFRDREEKIRAVFDNLTTLDHVNLVKFHKYWTDSKSEKPRIIFITEYMSSGSMSKFLQRAKSSETLSNMRMWKKWIIQILSALNYLHSCYPPIAHANLSCNTIFIQQNGLIKIGCVAPNAIHHHVKTFRENIRNLHYIAPEYEYLNDVTTQADIYSFGICALELATRGCLPTNGDAGAGGDTLAKAIAGLENPLLRDFILKCTDPDPKARPTARQLLFHPALFEVHSLKLLAAHVIVRTKLFDHLSEDDLRIRDTSRPAAVYCGHSYSYADMESVQACKMDLDKFLEDVKNGIYPLTAFAGFASRPLRLMNNSPSSSAVSGLRGSASSGIVNRSDDSQHTSVARNQSTVNFRRPSADDLNRSMTNAADSDGLHSDYIESDAYTAGGSGAGGSNAGSSGLPKVPSSIDMSSAASTINSATTGSLGSPSFEPPMDKHPSSETRHIVHMRAAVKDQLLSMLLQLDDQMNRQLTTEVSEHDHADELVGELILHGFISDSDSVKVCQLLSHVLQDYREELAKTHTYYKSRESSAPATTPSSTQLDSSAMSENTDTDTSTTGSYGQLQQQALLKHAAARAVAASNAIAEAPRLLEDPVAPRAQPEDISDDSPPPSMTAPPQQPQ
uniref:Protein kinase domain-containing protein n=1 Tax=Panagrellus redivivus TaxID=6233 RepID=A0A7E4V7H2_PANRE